VNRLSAVVSTVALLGLIGCKQEDPTIAAKDYPQQMAFGYCEAVFSCPCEDYPYTNFNECVGDLNVAYDELNNEAFLAGLTYDGTCPAKELDGIAALACKSSIAPLPAGVCIQPCNAWHGPLPAGSLCEVVASSAEVGLGFSACAQGLTCLGGVCVNPCQLGGDLPGLGEACPEFVCDVGGMCDATMMVCVAVPELPGPGEPCESGLCDADRAVCVADANVCAALPTIGQECLQGQCDLNSYCGADNVCLARPALACGLLGGSIPGDGDGDPTGDGDGDPTGDGDGDPTGDGDGDPTGDGDGDGDCSPTPLSNSVPAFASGSTVGAPAADNGSCGGGGNEVAYSFIAPISGLYYMSLLGSDFDTVLYVRDGGCTGAEIACNDDDVEGTTSALEVELFEGQEVVIFIDGYDGSGSYALGVDLL
jgi:hypothetical protein